MAEENKDTKPTFKTADELSTFLLDLQGQIVNLTETVDKLSPVEEGEETPKEETPTEEAPTEEEINEIDKLLQGN